MSAGGLPSGPFPEMDDDYETEDEVDAEADYEGRRKEGLRLDSRDNFCGSKAQSYPLRITWTVLHSLFVRKN